MAYYEYDDPNCDLLYYEEYPEIELLLDEPPQEFRFKKRRRRKRAKPVMNHFEESASDEADIVTEYVEYAPPRYVVPVMYAPVMSDPKKNEQTEDIYVHEDIDIYYNDPVNLEREAGFFYAYSQPFYASTIQEESESSGVSCGPKGTIVKGDFHEDSTKEVTRGRRSDSIESKGQRIKKRKKHSHNGEKIKETDHGITSHHKGKKQEGLDEFPEKLDTSNSWTTLQSSHYGVVKNEMKNSEILKDFPKTTGNESTIKKSRSLIDITEKSDENVKLHVTFASKNVNDDFESELKAVRDTDDAQNYTKMKLIKDNYRKHKKNRNAKLKARILPNVANESVEMITWQNKSMNMDSTTTTTNTSKSSYQDASKSAPTVPISSDTTDITINTDEYREFMKSLDKPIRQVTASNSQNYQQESPNIVSIDEVKENSITVSAANIKETFLEKIIKAKELADYNKRENTRKINPLIEVPLSFSSRSIFIPSFLATQFPVIVKSSNENKRVDVIVKKTSPLFKMLRFVTGTIGSFQNFLYKYFLRYILFV